MLDWSQCPAVERDPGKLSGAWVFRETRVPVTALFENLEDGATVDDFLSWFPGVRREQIEELRMHERLAADDAEKDIAHRLGFADQLVERLRLNDFLLRRDIDPATLTT